MSTLSEPLLSGFALDVLQGLSARGQKRISSQYLYDDLGSSLFEAITLLPEYGLTRADERLLSAHSNDIASAAGPLGSIAELGSGSGKKTQYLLEAARKFSDKLVYSPIDVSPAALEMCAREVGDLADVRPICSDWLEGITRVSRIRPDGPLLLLFLGSTIGNLPRNSLPEFLSRINSTLQPGDFFLLGADLVKDVDFMLAAYDDPTGVTAAFNLNLLGRINRELSADFDLRAFVHEARWNAQDRRIEMHLMSCREQDVCLGALGTTIHFEPGETIWTESSHKFTESELLALAESSGFSPVAAWTDREWPFTEALWEVLPR
ncbi:MAG: L-histidine N(alpha)-methyltransferase [Acidobacteriota bacterium]|nr:L-histidine N(alpha)-methyltransferase [Acidobacteriota bacterium]MDQ2843665.1 L-histidine N(alpha)-methyltransferase [Acidobacteriota bacterium]